MVFEKLVALGTSCSSGWSRHTVPTKPSTPEIITTPTHLPSSAGEQIAPTISLPTFPSCARARCKHHSDCTPYVPTTLCRHHFAPFTPPPACARLPVWGDLWNRPSPAPYNLVDDFLTGDGSLLSNLPARLSRSRTSRGLNLRGLTCHYVQSKLSFCHKRNLLRDSLQPLHHSHYTIGTYL